MPKYAISGPAGRSYRIPGIEHPFVSVTTAIGVINKPALVNWAARMAAEKAVDSNLWQSIRDEEGRDAAVKYLAAASGNYSADRRNLGSMLHWLAETHENPLYSQDDVDGKMQWYLEKVADPDKVLKEAELMFGHYKDFLAERKPRFILREHTVFNATKGYAGTLDCVVEMDGSALVGDIKTGGVYPEQVILQLSAYRYAEYYIDKETDRALDMPETEGGFVLNITKDGWSVEEYVCGEDSYKAFLAALRLYEWTQTHPDLLRVK